MKKLFAWILTIAMSFALFSACGQSGTTETTGVPQATQSPEEEKALRIIVLGNSHSNDAFWLLHEVFADQMPEQEVTLGVMYYSGCPIDKHVEFYTKGERVYEYHSNSNGQWETMEEVTLDMGLRHQAWDYVLLQPGRADRDDTYNQDGRRALEKIVADNVLQPYVLGWHSTWTSPDEPTFYSPDYEVQPPAGYMDTLRQYGDDLIVRYNSTVSLSVDTILKDDTYDKKLNIGAGIMYAHLDEGVPELDLWRDYTHLSDYGRLIAAYSFYVQFTGEPITQINIDSIPAALRHRRFRSQGDLEVTEEMKQVIIAAANKSLAQPWVVVSAVSYS